MDEYTILKWTVRKMTFSLEIFNEGTVSPAQDWKIGKGRIDTDVLIF